MEIMGFDIKGDVVVFDMLGCKLLWEEIGKCSVKVIIFSDLVGYECYFCIMVFGLLFSSLNYCFLMVVVNNGLIGMSKEYFGIVFVLNVFVMVVIIKIDICLLQILEQMVNQIIRILKSLGVWKILIFIKNWEECINMVIQFVSQCICFIFQVFNVMGENFDLV